MLINNKDIKTFGGKLLNKEIKNVDIETQEIWNRQALLPLSLSKKCRYKHIELEILITNETETETEISISNILKEFVNDNIEIKFVGLNLIYNITSLVGNTTEKTLRKERKKLILELVGYCYTDLITEELNRVTTKTIYNLGNLPTPAIIEITPSINIIDIVINGLSDDPIIIKNLKQDKTIIIDGEKCTVLENGINKFADTDMWEFPKLKEGQNNIALSKNSCNVKIKYKARYI